MGFEQGLLGDPGDADFWGIVRASSAISIAGYLAGGGNLVLHSEAFDNSA